MSILEHPQQPSSEERAAPVWLPNRRNAEIRTYRGKSLEQLLPRIRKDLGADAVILREREGLMGGVGGFFATRFVEIEARAGASIDVFDGSDEDDELALRDLASPAGEELPALPAVSEFSAQLQEAVQAWSAEAPELALEEPEAARPEPEPALEEPKPHPEPADSPMRTAMGSLGNPGEPRVDVTVRPEPVRVKPARSTPVKPVSKPVSLARTRLPRTAPAPRPVDTEAAGRVLSDLVELGVSDGFARELLGAGAGHGAAVAGGLRAAVRAELARRLTAAAPLPPDGAAIAFVGTGGSGKSLASAALAATYRYGSTLPVSVASLCETADQRRLAERLSADGVPVSRVPEPGARTAAAVRTQIASRRRTGVVIIDTPGVSPADVDGLADLSERLDQLSPDAVHVVLSATLGARPARRALSGLAPLAPTAIVISHADETDQVGVLIELAATEGLAISYLVAGSDHRRSLIETDPAALARLLLP